MLIGCFYNEYLFVAFMYKYSSECIYKLNKNDLKSDLHVLLVVTLVYNLHHLDFGLI